MIRRVTQKFTSIPDLERYGLRVDVIGDSGPFSEVGKSIGYRVSYRGKRYLLDCGAPLFQQLGIDGVREIDALFSTHSHDDHKRWFTDLALFLFYSTSPQKTLKLVTSDELHDEYRVNSLSALERTLSFTSDRIVDVPYSKFVRTTSIGPRALYRIVGDKPDERGNFTWRVLNSDGVPVPPSRAKVFMQPWGSRPRMLFKDPVENIWVEPCHYYTFGDPIFYDGDPRHYVDEETGLRVEAHNAGQWHGPPTVGYKFVTPDGENLFFSSDTVYNPVLWQKLASEVRPLPDGMDMLDFESCHIVFDDINKYIQKSWSENRLQAALTQYTGCALIHDVADPGSVVHTDYKCLLQGPWNHLILTHSPDLFTSEIPLLQAGMSVIVHRNTFFEVVDGRLYNFNADFYIKRDKRYFVAKRDPNGDWEAIQAARGLKVAIKGDFVAGDKIADIRVFESVGGHYFAYRGEQGTYVVRRDERIEFLREEDDGSRGDIVKSVREEYFGPPLLHGRA